MSAYWILGKNILFYDGICGLCDGLVRWIKSKDQKNKIEFLALQSDEARTILETNKISQDMDTVVFFTSGQFFFRSDAMMEVFKLLPLPWNFLSILKFIPRKLRDYAYKIVALSRYKIWGKLDQCEWNPAVNSKDSNVDGN